MRQAEKESGMNDTATELLKIEKDWAEAFETNDAAAVGRFMADDWSIIGSDGSVLDRAAFLAFIKSGSLTHSSMELEDASVRVYGDAALVTARGSSEGKFNGKAFSEVERLTDVFVKQGGRWKCVLTQLTRLAKK